MGYFIFLIGHYRSGDWVVASENSLSSLGMFKHDGEEPSYPQFSFGEECVSKVIISVLAFLCKGVIALNRFDIQHHERLLSALEEKDQDNRGLITVANHISTLDDPVGVIAITPIKNIIDHKRKIRWTVGARDILFENRMSSSFFKLGQVTPITRGEGLRQSGLADAARLLDSNKWVHIFPEGKVQVEEYGGLNLMKPGVGKIVLLAKKVPIIVPFHLAGMREFSFRPVGQHVTITIGERIYVDDIMESWQNLDEDEKKEFEKEYCLQIAQRIQDALQELSIQHKELCSAEDCPHNKIQ